MKRALTVARWEYIEKIKSKAFIVSLFFMPTVIIVMGIVPSLLASRGDSETKSIGIIDRSDEITATLSDRLAERYTISDSVPNYALIPIDPENRETLEGAKKLGDALVTQDGIEGYLIVGSSFLADSAFEYRSENTGNIRVVERLSSTLRDVIREKTLRERGVDPSLLKDLMKRVDLRTIRISKEGDEEEKGFAEIFFSGYIFMMMMVFLVMTSGQMLVRSILEEKSNRVIEVLVSSCSPMELMAGKVIGLSGLGLTQMGFWVLIGLGISLKMGAIPIAPVPALLLFTYFILGYLLYAAVFVAAGSPISTEQEAQQLTGYFVLILIFPIVLAVPMMQEPDSMLIRVLTFVPLMTPTMMALRIPVQMPSPVEIIGSLLLLAGSAFGMMWVAGKIFRTAVLMYGKRPSISELIKLIKTP